MMGADITLWLESSSFVDDVGSKFYSPIAQLHYGRNSVFFQILREQFEEEFELTNAPSGIPLCIQRIPVDVSMDVASECLIKVDSKLPKYSSTKYYRTVEWNTEIVRSEDEAFGSHWFIKDTVSYPYTGYFLHGPSNTKGYFYRQDLVNSGYVYYESFKYIISRYVHYEKYEPVFLSGLLKLMQVYHDAGTDPRLVYWFDQ